MSTANTQGKKKSVARYAVSIIRNAGWRGPDNWNSQCIALAWISARRVVWVGLPLTNLPIMVYKWSCTCHVAQGTSLWKGRVRDPLNGPCEQIWSQRPLLSGFVFVVSASASLRNHRTELGFLVVLCGRWGAWQPTFLFSKYRSVWSIRLRLWMQPVSAVVKSPYQLLQYQWQCFLLIQLSVYSYLHVYLTRTTYIGFVNFDTVGCMTRQVTWPV